jgi:hypothetical protein
MRGHWQPPRMHMSACIRAHAAYQVSEPAFILLTSGACSFLCAQELGCEGVSTSTELLLAVQRGCKLASRPLQQLLGSLNLLRELHATTAYYVRNFQCIAEMRA